MGAAFDLWHHLGSVLFAVEVSDVEVGDLSSRLQARCEKQVDVVELEVVTSEAGVVTAQQVSTNSEEGLPGFLLTAVEGDGLEVCFRQCMEDTSPVEEFLVVVGRRLANLVFSLDEQPHDRVSIRIYDGHVQAEHETHALDFLSQYPHFHSCLSGFDESCFWIAAFGSDFLDGSDVGYTEQAVLDGRLTRWMGSDHSLIDHPLELTRADPEHACGFFRRDENFSHDHQYCTTWPV